jgi:TetR/AcrR family transcriptional repressor of nem operon
MVTDKKTEIMQFAQRELAAKGVHGFSFRHVAAACNIKSSSVHYHFPKKNNLIIAVLEKFVESCREQFESWDREESNPRKRLGKYLKRIRDLAKDCSSSTFCPVMMAAAELGLTDPAVVRVTRKFFDTAVEWLKQQLRVIRGHDEATPEDAFDAELIYQMLEGGLISVRVTGEPQRIETVLRTIERQVLG